MKVLLTKNILSLVFSVFFLLPFVVSAGTEHNMSGWAWSSNIGWISFNCTDDNSCAISNYGVNKNADDTITGYALSPNIGWIQFGGLSGFPGGGGGTQAQNANINGNNLKGWAKAIGADGNGWDGWIALSGAGPNYGALLSGNYLVGYAWGSSVIGWISFDIAGADGVIIGPVVPPVVPGFTLAGPSSLKIQFLGQNGADSESGTYFVDNGGTSYNLPITVSMDLITPSLPSGTTILYSLDSGANFSASPSTVISNYAQGIGLKARLNKNIGTAITYTMHLKGIGQDGKTAIRDIILSPVLFNPQFEEL